MANFTSLLRAMGLVWLTAHVGLAQAQLPDKLSRVIKGHKISEDNISLLVQAVDQAQPLLALNITTARNPASTIKLLTTFVALQTLGPTYTWPTEIYTLGPVREGRLEGDLLIKGFGDPSFVVEEFWKLLGALKRHGVEHITGDLVIDGSYFNIPEGDSGAFDSNPYRLYNVLPSTVLPNFKAIHFHFRPSLDGKTVDIQIEPELPNLQIINRLKVTGGRCHGQLNLIMNVPDKAKADRVIFSGGLPRACRSHTFSRSLLQPETYTFGLFKSLWAQWGGQIDGTVRQGHVPEAEQPIIVWQSKPLAEIIRSVNKWSNNVMTRLLLYSLATKSFEPPVSREQGIKVIEQYLAANQIDANGLVIDNGAGLSRKTRITAKTMAQLLMHAYQSPFMSEFIASMSIAGMDGTMRRRFRGRPEAGQMHIKTGRLDGAVAIAGYVKAKSGSTYVVSLLLSHKNAHWGAGTEIQNALLSWVYQQ